MHGHNMQAIVHVIRVMDARARARVQCLRNARANETYLHYVQRRLRTINIPKAFAHAVKM